MKIKVNPEFMVAAAQIVAAQIQHDPSIGQQEALPRALQQAYHAIWLAQIRLENDSDLNS